MPFALTKPAGVPGKSWPAIAIGMFVAFGGVLFGSAKSHRVVPAESLTLGKQI